MVGNTTRRSIVLEETCSGGFLGHCSRKGHQCQPHIYQKGELCNLTRRCFGRQLHETRQ